MKLHSRWFKLFWFTHGFGSGLGLTVLRGCKFGPVSTNIQKFRAAHDKEKSVPLFSALDDGTRKFWREKNDESFSDMSELRSRGSLKKKLAGITQMSHRRFVIFLFNMKPTEIHPRKVFGAKKTEKFHKVLDWKGISHGFIPLCEWPSVVRLFCLPEPKSVKKKCWSTISCWSVEHENSKMFLPSWFSSLKNPFHGILEQNEQMFGRR